MDCGTPTSKQQGGATLKYLTEARKMMKVESFGLPSAPPRTVKHIREIWVKQFEMMIKKASLASYLF